MIDALDRRQRQPGLSGAEDDRGNNHMQAIETPGGEELRDRVGAAFDQDSAQPARRQCGEDRGWRDVAVGGRKRDDFDAGWKSCLYVGCGHDQAAHAVVGEHAGARR